MVNKYKPANPLTMYGCECDGSTSKDSEMFDKVAQEQIEMGGVTVYAYRYLGTPPPQERDFNNVRADPAIVEPVDIGSFLGIEDPVFMENRDRAYDLTEVPRLKGVYKVSQDDIIYGGFGPGGLNNDVFSIEFHTGSVEAALGRRFIIGDVLEFPHLKDISVSGNIQSKLYEVARVMKSPTGWDLHYVNHILAVILRPVRDQQEFIQFMERTDQYGKTLADQVSTGPGMLELDKALREKAAELAPDGPWDDSLVWTDPKDIRVRPNWWVDDGHPPNGIVAEQGTGFPLNPIEFAYYLRTDFYPNRLFQFYNNRWHQKQMDKHLKWQNYAYIRKWQTFLVDRIPAECK